MRQMLNWIKSWFCTAQVCRQLSGQKDHLDRLQDLSSEHAKRLAARERELNALVELVRDEIADAGRMQRRTEAALDEVREQNRVLETTIRTLVASHELLISRYDAETAIAVRARVAATRE